MFSGSERSSLKRMAWASGARSTYGLLLFVFQTAPITNFQSSQCCQHFPLFKTNLDDIFSEIHETWRKTPRARESVRRKTRCVKRSAQPARELAARRRLTDEAMSIRYLRRPSGTSGVRPLLHVSQVTPNTCLLRPLLSVSVR